MKLQKILGQPSWRIDSDAVKAAVTRLGGHLGPVTYKLAGKSVQPFHVAPWAEEAGLEKGPALMQAMRGDFFCMPFGSSDTLLRGEKHPPHGETANSAWKFASFSAEGDRKALHLQLRTSVRPATVDKLIEVRAGQPAVYVRHVISGATGPMNLGQHAMIDFSKAKGGGRISMSPIAFGQVYPGQFENPAAGGYSSLKAGAEFRSLDKVPLAAGGFADLTSYPAREGFEDLVMVSAAPGGDLAFTAATFPGEDYVWFCLKDPRVLVSTVMWHSNGGRHYAPWSGRHRGILGLEEVTSYFHEGLPGSARKNPVSDRGIPTTVRLNPKRPLAVNVIMAMAQTPPAFGIVKSLGRIPGGVVLTGEKGLRVEVPLDVDFLYQR